MDDDARPYSGYRDRSGERGSWGKPFTGQKRPWDDGGPRPGQSRFFDRRDPGGPPPASRSNGGGPGRDYNGAGPSGYRGPPSNFDPRRNQERDHSRGPLPHRSDTWDRPERNGGGEYRSPGKRWPLPSAHPGRDRDADRQPPPVSRHHTTDRPRDFSAKPASRGYVDGHPSGNVHAAHSTHVGGDHRPGAASTPYWPKQQRDRSRERSKGASHREPEARRHSTERERRRSRDIHLPAEEVLPAEGAYSPMSSAELPPPGEHGEEIDGGMGSGDRAGASRPGSGAADDDRKRKREGRTHPPRAAGSAPTPHSDEQRVWDAVKLPSSPPSSAKRANGVRKEKVAALSPGELPPTEAAVKKAAASVPASPVGAPVAASEKHSSRPSSAKKADSTAAAVAPSNGAPLSSEAVLQRIQGIDDEVKGLEIAVTDWSAAAKRLELAEAKAAKALAKVEEVPAPQPPPSLDPDQISDVPLSSDDEEEEEEEEGADAQHAKGPAKKRGRPSKHAKQAAQAQHRQRLDGADAPPPVPAHRRHLLVLLGRQVGGWVEPTVKELLVQSRLRAARAHAQFDRLIPDALLHPADLAVPTTDSVPMDVEGTAAATSTILGPTEPPAVEVLVPKAEGDPAAITAALERLSGLGAAAPVPPGISAVLRREFAALLSRHILSAVEYRARFERYKPTLLQRQASSHELRRAASVREPMSPTATSLGRSASRGRNADVVRSDYEEKQAIATLGLMELTKRMTVLPSQRVQSEREKRWVGQYVDRNRLVEDPVEADERCRLVRPFTEEERTVFAEKFLHLHKDFHRIAAALPGRSYQEVVALYYALQKSDEFAATKRKYNMKKRREKAESAAQERTQGLRGMGMAIASYHPLDAALSPLQDLPAPAASQQERSTAAATRTLPRTGSTRGGRGHSRATPLPVNPPPPVPSTHGKRSRRSRATVLATRTYVLPRADSFFPDTDPVLDLHANDEEDEEEEEYESLDVAQLSGDSDDASFKLSGGGGNSALGISSRRSRSVSFKDAADWEAGTGTGKVPALSRQRTADPVVDAAFCEAVRLHGRHMPSISQHLGGAKTPAAARQFYTRNRVRLGLDAVLAEHLAGRGGGEEEGPDLGNADSMDVSALPAAPRLDPVAWAPVLAIAQAGGDESGVGAALAAVPVPERQALWELLQPGGGMVKDEDRGAAAALAALLTSPEAAAQGVAGDSHPVVPLLASVLGQGTVAPPAAPAGVGKVGRGGPKRGPSSYWTVEEKAAFVDCFKVHGRNWARLEAAVPSKTPSQIQNFWQNYRTKLGLTKMKVPPAATKQRGRKRKIPLPPLPPLTATAPFIGTALVPQAPETMTAAMAAQANLLHHMLAASPVLAGMAGLLPGFTSFPVQPPPPVPSTGMGQPLESLGSSTLQHQLQTLLTLSSASLTHGMEPGAPDYAAVLAAAQQMLAAQQEGKACAMPSTEAADIVAGKEEEGGRDDEGPPGEGSGGTDLRADE